MMMEPTVKLKVKQFVKQSYWQLRADKLTLYPLILTVFFIVASLLILFLKASALPSQVPLFYSLPWGEERLTKAFMLVLLPVSSGVIFFLNVLSAAYFYEKEILLSRVLIICASFISFLSFYTLMRIVFLIT